MSEILDSLLEEERLLSSQLEKLLLNEDILLKQNSHVNWLKEGDKNTKYFHLSTMVHTSNNRIMSFESPNG